MLVIERAESNSIASGVGISKLSCCDYQYVPSLSDVRFPISIIRPFVWDGNEWIPDLTPVSYKAETELWDTGNAWLEYKRPDDSAYSVREIELTGTHRDLINLIVVTLFTVLP